MTRGFAARVAGALFVAVLGLHAGSPVHAHVISNREVALFRALPADTVEALLAAESPERRLHAPDPAALTGTVFALAWFAVKADTAAAESHWRAIDELFVRQRPDGRFRWRGAAPAATPDMAPPLDDARASDIAATLAVAAEMSRTFVVLENSPLWPRFRWRVALTRPKLRRTMDSLLVRAAAVEAWARGAAERELLIAEAFLLADGIYHEPAWGLLGQKHMVLALGAQDSTGAFAPRSAPDAAARQARAIQRLRPLVAYFPTASLERAEARGAAWLARAASRPGAARVSAGAPWSDAPPAAAAFTLRSIADLRQDAALRAAAVQIIGVEMGRIRGASRDR